MLPRNKDIQKFLFGASKNIAAALIFKTIGIDNLFYGALIGSAGDIFYDKFKKNLEQVNFNQLISYSDFLKSDGTQIIM